MKGFIYLLYTMSQEGITSDMLNNWALAPESKVDFESSFIIHMVSLPSWELFHLLLFQTSVLYNIPFNTASNSYKLVTYHEFCEEIFYLKYHAINNQRHIKTFGLNSSPRTTRTVSVLFMLQFTNSYTNFLIYYKFIALFSNIHKESSLFYKYQTQIWLH